MNKLFKSSLLALIAITMAALSACTSKEMFDRVPADVDFVMVGNLDQLIKNAGFEVTDTDIKGPKELKAALNSIPNEKRETLTALHSSIDCERMIVMGYISDDPEFVSMAKITDKELFSKTLRDDLEADRSSVKGFDVYEVNRRSYVVTDESYAYYCVSRSAEDAALMVKKFNNRAEDKNITSIGSVMDVISKENTLNLAYNTNSLADLMKVAMTSSYIDPQSAFALQSVMPYLKGNWFGLNANYSGTELNVDTYLFNEESGDKVQYPGLKEVDTSLMKYLPANTIASAAVGIDNETLKKNLKQFKEMGYGDPMINEFVDQLGNLDGTVAIGMGISNEDQLVEVFVDGMMKADVTLVAQMREGKAANFKDYLVNFAEKVGIKTEQAGNATKISARNFEWYLMVKDNNFIVSTKPDVNKSDNATIKMFDNVNSGMAVNVPTIAKLIGGNSKAGFESSLLFKDNTMTFNVKALNVGDNIYGAIMELGPDFNALKKKINQAWNKKYESSYESNYDNYDDYGYADDSAYYEY